MTGERPPMDLPKLSVTGLMRVGLLVAGWLAVRVEGWAAGIAGLWRPVPFRERVSNSWYLRVKRTKIITIGYRYFYFGTRQKQSEESELTDDLL